jgi:hypothetical protein
MSDNDDTTINDDDLKEISEDAFDEVVEMDADDEIPAVVADDKEAEVFGEVDPDAGVDEEDAELLLGEYDDSDSF